MDDMSVVQVALLTSVLLCALLVVLEAAGIFLVDSEARAGVRVGVFVVGVVEQLGLLLWAVVCDGRVAVQLALACRGLARHLRVS